MERLLENKGELRNSSNINDIIRKDNLIRMELEYYNIRSYNSF